MSFLNVYWSDVKMTGSTDNTATPSPIPLLNMTWPNTINLSITQTTIIPSPTSLLNTRSLNISNRISNLTINIISPNRILRLYEPEGKASIIIYDESKISLNGISGISTPQESSDSHPIVSEKTPKSPSQTPILTKPCLKRLDKVEILAESYNLSILSSCTDKGFRKEQLSKKPQ